MFFSVEVSVRDHVADCPSLQLTDDVFVREYSSVCSSLELNVRFELLRDTVRVEVLLFSFVSVRDRRVKDAESCADTLNVSVGVVDIDIVSLC